MCRVSSKSGNEAQNLIVTNLSFSASLQFMALVPVLTGHGSRKREKVMKKQMLIGLQTRKYFLESFPTPELWPLIMNRSGF